MIDLSIYANNNAKTLVAGTVGSIGITLPGNMGTMATGVAYKVGTIPAGSVILDVQIVVDTLFNGDSVGDGTGTKPAVNVGYTGALTAFASALAVNTTGIKAGTAGESVATESDIIVTPTIYANTTAGDLRVVVTFVETATVTGMFTA